MYCDINLQFKTLKKYIFKRNRITLYRKKKQTKKSTNILQRFSFIDIDGLAADVTLSNSLRIDASEASILGILAVTECIMMS